MLSMLDVAATQVRAPTPAPPSLPSQTLQGAAGLAMVTALDHRGRLVKAEAYRLTARGWEHRVPGRGEVTARVAMYSMPELRGAFVPFAE